MMGDDHTDEKFYFCPYAYCVKRFSLREKLEDHVRVHERDGPPPAPPPQGRVSGGGGGGGGRGDNFDADTESE